MRLFLYAAAICLYSYYRSNTIFQKLCYLAYTSNCFYDNALG